MLYVRHDRRYNILTSRWSVFLYNLIFRLIWKDLQEYVKKTGTIYLLVCIAAGIGLMVQQTVLNISPLSTILPAVLYFSLLAVIAESQGLAIDDDKAISISFAIDISALLLFGLPAAVWVSFSTAFFSVMDSGRGHKLHVFNTPIYKSLFNASNYILSIFFCGIVFEALGGTYLLAAGPLSIGDSFLHLVRQLPAIIAGLIVYIVVNTLMIVIYFSLTIEHPQTLMHDWFRIFRWSVISMIMIGTLGVSLAAVYHAFGFLALLLFFAPFLLFRYAYVGFISVQRGYIDTIKALSAALEAKDRYTVGHARRVEKYCEIIAREMNLSSERTKVLKYASLLHDIGKIGVSEAILNKPGDLTDEEYQEIQRHPEIGAQMLSGIQYLKKEIRLIHSHHVHYDGSGYPQTPEALADSRLLESQILCVADSFDAMTSDRSYHGAMNLERATEEMRIYAGTQFAPDVVEALISGLEKQKSLAPTANLHDLISF